MKEEDKLKKKLSLSSPKSKIEGMLVGLCWFVVGKSRECLEFKNGTLVLIKLGV